MEKMTYGDAIAYLANNGYVFKAIRDLSECAQLFVDDIQKEKAELRAEKRTVKKFLEWLNAEALEKQEVDKCCETCKHRNRKSWYSPCKRCYLASNLEDYYEPYTEEDND